MIQQLYEDQPSLNQKEVLNALCENEEESSLNILLKEVLVANVTTEIAIISDEIDRVPGS